MSLEREVILIVGKTGLGKTLWTRRYIAGLKRVIVLDPVLEYEGILFDDLTEMIEHIQANSIYQVRSEFAQDLPWLSTIAMAAGECRDPSKLHHRGCVHVALVVDEGGRALPPYLPMHPAVQDVIYRGRHRHVTLIIVSQRASTVSIHARSQFTRLISFAQTEPADVRAIEQMAGERLTDLTALDKFEYYDVTPKGVSREQLDLAMR